MFNKTLLREKMKEQGLSQRALADRVTISQPMIAAIMLGYKQPSLELAARIADAVGCRVDDLIE